MSKALLVLFVLVFLGVVVAGIYALQAYNSQQVAVECLGGNPYACELWEAQANFDRAQEALKQAEDNYEKSKAPPETPTPEGE